MATFALVSALLGAAMSGYFNILALIPASIFALGFVATEGVMGGHDPIWSMAAAIAAVVALQFGYVLGIAAQSGTFEAHTKARHHRVSRNGFAAGLKRVGPFG